MSRTEKKLQNDTLADGEDDGTSVVGFKVGFAEGTNVGESVVGESEGDFADTNFSSNVQDLIHAAQAMENDYDAPSMLIGHSLGGAAVIFAAKHIPRQHAGHSKRTMT